MRKRDIIDVAFISDETVTVFFFAGVLRGWVLAGFSGVWLRREF